MAQVTLPLLFLIVGAIEMISPFILAYLAFKHFKLRLKTIALGVPMFLMTTLIVMFMASSITTLNDRIGEPLILAILGGSLAGICEELIKYAMIKYGIPDIRTVRQAIGFSIGWNAILTILIGMTLMITGIIAWGMQNIDENREKLSNETIASLGKLLEEDIIVDHFDLLNSLVMVYAYLMLHITWTVQVLKSITENKIKTLLRACGTHAFLSGGLIFLIDKPPQLTGLFLLLAGTWAYQYLKRLPELK